jgi:hypothetical protein
VTQTTGTVDRCGAETSAPAQAPLTTIARRTSGPRLHDVSSSMESAPELVSFLERMFRNLNALDANATVDTFSRQPGLLLIGTDPDEWWEGFEAASALWRVQFQELQSVGRFHFDIEEAVAWKEGTVGWIACRARWVSEGVAPLSYRMTVVLHEDGAYWRVVQWHSSLGASNEESFGFEMTTDVDEILTMVRDEPPPVGALAGDGSVTIMFTDIEGSTALMESLEASRPGWNCSTGTTVW